MVIRKLVVAAAVAVSVAAAAASATAWDSAARTTIVTFSGPVGLPGVTLGAGTYVFEVASPETSLDVVRVRSKDRSLVYFAGITQLVSRPEGLGSDRIVTFGEAPPGIAPPIAAWYPIGSALGHRFLYRNR
jgi:hypothetical protein